MAKFPARIVNELHPDFTVKRDISSPLSTQYYEYSGVTPFTHQWTKGDYYAYNVPLNYKKESYEKPEIDDLEDETLSTASGIEGNNAVNKFYVTKINLTSTEYI